METDPVTLGYRSKISVMEEYGGDSNMLKGVIEEVSPRDHVFTRQMPASGGRSADKLPDREQVIIAIPDQVVFVFSCAKPSPRSKMLDRFLVRLWFPLTPA